MSRNRRHRGISLGTVVMLMITVLVCAGFAYLLPALYGNRPFALETNRVLGALSLTGMPELALSDIPIQHAEDVQPETAGGPTYQPQATATPTLAATATPAPQQSPTATPAPRAFTMAFTGSVMIETSVRQGAYLSEAEKYDFTGLLSYLKPELASADLCVVPVENIIDNSRDYNGLVTTPQMTQALTSAGVDAIALGFPKLANKGFEGVQSTIDALRESGFSVIGAYEQPEDAAVPTLMTLNGVKVAVLHYTTSLTSSGQKKLNNEDAAYAVSIATADRVAGDIAAAKAAGAEFIVVSVHWGNEDDTTPNNSEKKLAQAMADAGADVIVGTGTRAVQPVVWLDAKRADGSIGKTLCAYSLGALVNEGRSDANVASFILQMRVSVSRDGTIVFESLDCVPTYAWRYKEDGAYRYFIVPSAEVAPDTMSDQQKTSMERALKNVRKTLKDSPLNVP